MGKVIGQRRVNESKGDSDSPLAHGTGVLYRAAAGALTALRQIAVALAALVSLGVLYGYGVALGLASRLGLDPAIFFGSVLDLLVLAGRGLLADLLALLKAFAEFGLPDARDAAAAAGIATAVLIGVLTLGVLLGRYFALRSNALTAAWKRFSASLSPYRPSREVVVTAAAVASAMVTGAALRWLLTAATLALVIVLAVIPILGMNAADRYLAVSVFDVAGCVGRPGLRWENLKLGSPPGHGGFGAICVQVSTSGGEMVAGRLVMHRGDLLVVYRPEQDDTVVLEAKGAWIRFVAHI